MPAWGWPARVFRSTPTSRVFAASMTIDVSQSNTHVISTIVTSDFALTLINFQDGDCGEIVFKQAAAGGKKITGITVAGRTALMGDSLTTLNTTPMLVANAKCRLTYDFFTAVDSVVVLNMVAGIAAAYT